MIEIHVASLENHVQHICTCLLGVAVVALPSVRFLRCNLYTVFFIFLSYTLVSPEKITRPWHPSDHDIHATVIAFAGLSWRFDRVYKSLAVSSFFCIRHCQFQHYQVHHCPIQTPNNPTHERPLSIMKTAVATAFALVATLAHAAPSPAPVEARQVPTAILTFQGAGPNPPSYTIAQPADNSVFTIGMSLKLSLPLKGCASPPDPILVFTLSPVPYI